MAISNLYNSVAPATNPNAPKLPYQTGEPLHRDPPGMSRSPIPGYRPEPPPLGFPLDPQPNGNKRGVATSQPAVSGNLSNFLRQWNSGHKVMDDEMYNYFGGDDILKELQKYDPNATFTETQMYNDGPMGRRLDFDVTKLPSTKLPNGQEIKGNDLLTKYKPTSMYDRLMINKNAKFKDSIYGELTDNRNVKKDKPAWWDYAAPALIGGLPMLAASGAMPMMARLAMGGISGLRGGLENFNPMSLAGTALGAGGSMLGGTAGSFLSNVGRYLPVIRAGAGLMRNN